MITRRVFQASCRRISTLRCTSTTTTTTTTAADKKATGENLKQKITLTDEQVKRYYKYFKISEYRYRDRTNVTFDDRIRRAASSWPKNTKLTQIAIRQAIESIICDVYQTNQHLRFPSKENKEVEIEFARTWNPPIHKHMQTSFYPYWVNIHLGYYGQKRSLKLRSPKTAVLMEYFHWKHREALRGPGDGETKLRVVLEMAKAFREMLDDETLKLAKEYMDWRLKGYKLVDSELVRVKDYIGGVNLRRFPHGVGPRWIDGERCRKEEFVRSSGGVGYKKTVTINHNLTTGAVIVDGLCVSDASNYFIWEKLNLGYGEELFLHERYLKLIEEWNNMSHDDQSGYFRKYETCFRQRKVLVYGEWKEMNPRLFQDVEIPHIKYVPTWGEYRDSGRSQTELPVVQVVRNQMAGNYVPIFPIGEYHAREYYVGKHLREILHKESKSIKQLLEMHYKTWDTVFEPRYRSQFIKEYQLLVSQGRVMLNGEIVSIEAMMQYVADFQGTKSAFIPDIVGQGIVENYTGTGLLARCGNAAPVILDHTTGSGVLVEHINPDLAFNYYLGRQLTHRLESGQPYDPHEVFREWEMNTNAEKKAVAEEYTQLLQDGKDMLYGKVVPIREKLAVAHRMTHVLVNGYPKEVELEFYRQKELEDEEDEDELDEDEAYEYYEYCRTLEGGRVKPEKARKEWEMMSDAAKRM
ncbi:hypothetical protein Cantr_06736 [Candida viswanathii]|uniref:Uncharacterized protein n=1 Tax=Candida viswanathii TaxID=5486 RepID=A0A367XUR9_9ASCO|nr:hypothetical protein Cantr_06736 [Candida viswanathii]